MDINRLKDPPTWLKLATTFIQFHSKCFADTCTSDMETKNEYFTRIHNYIVLFSYLYRITTRNMAMFGSPVILLPRMKVMWTPRHIWGVICSNHSEVLCCHYLLLSTRPPHEYKVQADGVWSGTQSNGISQVSYQSFTGEILCTEAPFPNLD